MKISKETKLGIFAAVAIATLIIGYNFLKGNDIFSSSKSFYALYDRVDGLTASKPIFVNGFQIGRVKELDLLPNGKILAMLEITEDIPIPRNSVAEIQSTDLLGSKAIYFNMGNATINALDGDTLQSSVEKSFAESVNPVKDKATSMLAKIDSILTSLNAIINPQFQKNINKSLQSITNSLQTLESTTVKVDNVVGTESKRLRNILENVESISANLKNNNEQVSHILANINSITNQVAKGKIQETLANANNATTELTSIMDKIKRGEGSLGALLNDEELYDNLNESAKNLDKLMIDLRENPGKYVHFSIIDFGGGKKKKKN